MRFPLRGDFKPVEEDISPQGLEWEGWLGAGREVSSPSLSEGLHASAARRASSVLAQKLAIFYPPSLS